MALSAAKRIEQLGVFGAHRSNHLLGAASVGYKGSIVALDTADSNLLKVGAASTTLLAIGIALADFDTGDDNVEIDSGIFKFENSATAAISNTHVGTVCYIEDDETASQTDQGNTLSPLGIVVEVDAADSKPYVWVGPQVLKLANVSAPSAALPSLHAVRVASTANHGRTGLAAIDGVTPVAGDRVLLKDQTAGAQNGIYVAAAGAWSRATDADGAPEVVSGMLIHVSEGTIGADEYWFLSTNATITLDTTALVFTQLPSLGDLAAVTAGNGANLIGYQDAGSFTAAATVDAALDEIYQHLLSTQSMIFFGLGDFIDAETAAGTPLTLFVDGAATLPGYSIVDSEALGIRWNNHATPGDVMASKAMPQDLDDSKDLTFHYMASKTGATLADAVTWESGVVFQTVGALHDADTRVVDTSSAMTGDATAKTVAELTATFGNGDLPAAPCVMNILIHPTDGTLGTDDVVLEAFWIEYSKKVLTS